MKRISNIEQGISKSEVEIAALGFASLAMTEDGGQMSEDKGQKADRR